MRAPLRGLLQAAARGRADLPLAVMKPAQVRWAIEAGFGPLLWYTTHAAPGAAASPLWPLVQGTDVAARLLTAEQFMAMGEILEACRGRMPPVTLLKGISISAQYYPLPHLRLMRDLDVLVDEAALPTLESVLSALGYRQQSHLPPTFYATHHHSMPFVHPARGLWIEIHRGLFPPSSRLGMDRLFRRETLHQQRQRSAFQGHEVFRLSPEWQLVYTAAHWARGYPHSGLVALLDVIYLLRRAAGAFDWERLLGWLEGSAAAAPLYLVLTYLEASRMIDLAPEVLRDLGRRQRALSPVSLALMQRLLTRHLVAGAPAGRVLSAHRLEVLWQTLLTPGSPGGNLLRVPWHWLVASRLGTGGATLWRRVWAPHARRSASP
jgi:hypothetical protein